MTVQPYVLNKFERDELKDMLEGEKNTRVRDSVTHFFLAQRARNAVIMVSPDPRPS